MRPQATADAIRTAPNARIANEIADRIQGDDVARPVFIQRIGSAWAVMAGGDHILSQGDFWDARDQMAKLLERDDDEI